MKAPVLIISLIVFILSFTGCDDGFLDVEHGEQSQTDDVGITDDVGSEQDTDTIDDIDDTGDTSPPDGCVDDQFAPDNFETTDAPLLAAGETFDNLVLCDNEDPNFTTRNWFYLGEISEINIELKWNEPEGALGLDFYSATGADGVDRSYHADGGTDASHITHNESLNDSTHLFARVYFRTEDKPEFGVTYTISRPN